MGLVDSSAQVVVVIGEEVGEGLVLVLGILHGLQGIAHVMGQGHGRGHGHGHGHFGVQGVKIIFLLQSSDLDLSLSLSFFLSSSEYKMAPFFFDPIKGLHRKLALLKNGNS